MNADGHIEAGCQSLSRPGRNVWLLARAVWLEALRRKDPWVIALLMAVYLMVAVAVRIVRGGTKTEAQFIFNLGLTFAFWLPAVLSALMAAREIPSEIEAGTLFPLLAKPVRRGEVILGKFAASAGVGLGTLAMFVFFAWLVSPWLAEYRLGLFLQCVALQMLALLILTALTVCVTVWAPSAVALMLGLGWYFGSGALMAALIDRVAPNARGVVAWVCAYFPNFSLYDLSNRFTQAGPPLSGGEFAGLLVSTLIFAALFLTVATWGFNRRAL